MKSLSRKVLTVVITAVLMMGTVLVQPSFATESVTQQQAQTALNRGVEYLHNYYAKNNYQGMLEDWAVISLMDAGEDLTSPRWTSASGKTAKQIINSELNNEDVILFNRNTDYQRVILSLAAVGIDPSNANGKDYLKLLEDSQLPSGKFEDTVGEGGENLINAQIWGIIASKSVGQSKIDEVKALNWLVNTQKDDGGYSIDVTIPDSDLDMSAMAINAMLSLGENKDSQYVNSVLAYLKNNQQDSGGFATWGMETAESSAAVIQALTGLGIDAQSDQWTIDGENPLSAMLKYQLADGSFAHYAGGRANLKATVQAVMALADYLHGETIFQRMTKGELNSKGLFLDVSESYWAYPAIKNLVDAKVVTGYPDNTFKPDKAVSRAEFVVLLIKGLKLQNLIGETTQQFIDLPETHWANPTIALAVKQNYVQGMTTERFGPSEQITGGQLATLLVRAGNYNDEVKTITGEKWYSGYVEVAKAHQLLYPDFNPDVSATRAQCSYSVYQLINLQ